MRGHGEVGHLICECGRIMGAPFYTEREEYCFCGVSRVDIDMEGARLVGRSEGRYVSLSFGNAEELEEEAAREISQKLGEELRGLAQRAGIDPTDARILTVGLGNREVTHDSLGARVCERLMPSERLAVFAVGVSGKNGIESPELVRAAAEIWGAELVIAVDSLAAKGVERVGRVIQLSDGGIFPGSGAGKSHGALDRELVGAPVISVGAPTALADETFGERGFLRVGDTVALVCEKLASIISDAIKIAVNIPK